MKRPYFLRLVSSNPIPVQSPEFKSYARRAGAMIAKGTALACAGFVAICGVALLGFLMLTAFVVDGKVGP